jgi:hypothetical protein
VRSIDIVLRALEERDCPPRGSEERRRWKALCPAHKDIGPSLTIGYDAVRGTTALHCFAGCSVQKVLDACALTWGDLFDDWRREQYRRRRREEWRRGRR